MTCDTSSAQHRIFFIFLQGFPIQSYLFMKKNYPQLFKMAAVIQNGYFLNVAISLGLKGIETRLKHLKLDWGLWANSWWNYNGESLFLYVYTRTGEALVPKKLTICISAITVHNQHLHLIIWPWNPMLGFLLHAFIFIWTNFITYYDSPLHGESYCYCICSDSYLFLLLLLFFSRRWKTCFKLLYLMKY